MKATKLLIAAVVVVSMVATPVFAAGIDLGNDSVQTVETRADWTKKTHQLGWDVAQYEADNGSMVSAPMEVNESADNPFSFVPTHVDFEDAGAFPHAAENESALDADSDWSTSGSLISVSDTEPAPGVKAVSVATDGSMTSTDTATASYSNFTVENDEAKKYLQVGVDVNTLDSGTVVWVRAVDANGDVKRAQINGTSGATMNESTIATGTGEGYVFQRQLGKMDTIASGDGTFNDIETVEVVVSNGDADVDISLLNLDKMSKYQYGTEKVDSDGDDNLESEDIYETTGTISISSLDSVGFSDSAEIKNLVVDAIFSADGSEIEAEFKETPDHAVYYGMATYYIPVGLESGYDISYANAETYANQTVSSDRIVEVSYAEAVGDTDPVNVTSWSSYTNSFTAEGTEVVIDNTKQPGQTSYVKVKLRFTEEAYNAAQQTGGGGPIFGPGAGGSGGLGNLPVIGAVIGALGMVWVRVRGLAPSWVPILGRGA